MLEPTSALSSLQQQVHRQAAYQDLIRQLTFAIRNSTDLTSVAQLGLQGATQVLQASRGAILRLKFWDPRQISRSLDRIPKARVILESTWQQRSPDVSGSVNPDAIEELSKPAAAAHSFWVSDCHLCQYAMTQGSQAIVFHDRAEFETRLAELGSDLKIAPALDPLEMPALILVPLESKNKLLGFLAIQSDQPRTWQPEEISVTELIAAQLSSAIIQTETLRQVESLVEERTAQLQQSLELQAKLYEITRKQIEKLREMNQRMDEFLSTLSHELRTPLTSMMLAIRMLRVADLSPERRLQYLNILEQQCAQETSLINDLLALQELETKQVAMQMQPVDLHQVLEDLVSSFDQRWSLKGLTLETEIPPQPLPLCTDAASLNRILLELLTNAGKYSEPNSVVRLQVRQTIDHQVEVTLTNVGAGISEEELPHIFDKFRRCQGMTQNAVPGTGLGLALVKSLVQHLNGTVAATSEPLPGGQVSETTFVVTLPQDPEVIKA